MARLPFALVIYWRSQATDRVDGLTASLEEFQTKAQALQRAHVLREHEQRVVKIVLQEDSLLWEREP